MTVNTNFLTWVEQEDPDQPLAPYVLNFATDTVWSFKISDTLYKQRRINPRGVMVDNTANNFTISVAIGPLTVTVQPLSRAAVSFPELTDRIVFTSPSGAGLMPIAFYMVAPAGEAVGIAPAPVTIGTNFTVANVAVGVAAVQLLAADTTRKSCFIEALDTNTGNIFIGGDNTVTTAKGLKLLPGDVAVIDRTTSAIFGIADAAGQNVRTGVEN